VGAALLRVNSTPGSSITEAEVKQFATLSLGRSLLLSRISPAPVPPGRSRMSAEFRCCPSDFRSWIFRIHEFLAADKAQLAPHIVALLTHIHPCDPLTHTNTRTGTGLQRCFCPLADAALPASQSLRRMGFVVVLAGAAAALLQRCRWLLSPNIDAADNSKSGNRGTLKPTTTQFLCRQLIMTRIMMNPALVIGPTCQFPGVKLGGRYFDWLSTTAI